MLLYLEEKEGIFLCATFIFYLQVLLLSRDLDWFEIQRGVGRGRKETAVGGTGKK